LHRCEFRAPLSDTIEAERARPMRLNRFGGARAEVLPVSDREAPIALNRTENQPSSKYRGTFQSRMPCPFFMEGGAK
jgi:hypothetical protein